MTCGFDRERIALHAGGDLPPAMVPKVEEHLLGCEACRHLLEEYRQGIQLVALDGAAARYPHEALPTRRRPAWRWAVVAVLVLVMVGTIGVVTESPAMAALLRILGVQVRELDADEAKQFQSEMQARWNQRSPVTPQFDENGEARDAQGRVIARRAVETTLEEAEKLAGYPLLQPRYLPEGFGLSRVLVYGGEEPRVILLYNNGLLSIELDSPGLRGDHYIDVPEGASEMVTVGGEPALLVRGTWGVGPDQKFTWTPGSPVSLSFIRGNQRIWIRVGRVGYPAEELIRIAESLQPVVE